MGTCRHNPPCASCNNAHGEPWVCNTRQTYQGPRSATFPSSCGNTAPTTTGPLAGDQSIRKNFPRSDLLQWMDYVLFAGRWKMDQGQQWTGNQCRADVQPDVFNRLQTARDNVGEFIRAEEINALIAAMEALWPDNYPPQHNDNKRGGPEGSIVYGQDFQNIQTKLNNLYLNRQDCPACVSGCNVVCEICNTCNACISTCCCD